MNVFIKCTGFCSLSEDYVRPWPWILDHQLNMLKNTCLLKNTCKQLINPSKKWRIPGLQREISSMNSSTLCSSKYGKRNVDWWVHDSCACYIMDFPGLYEDITRLSLGSIVQLCTRSHKGTAVKLLVLNWLKLCTICTSVIKVCGLDCCEALQLNHKALNLISCLLNHENSTSYTKNLGHNKFRMIYTSLYLLYMQVGPQSGNLIL